MPSKSKKQQRFMGMLYHCKETGDCPDKDIKEKAEKIKKKDVQEFAGTKHKGLPEKVKKKKKKKKGHMAIGSLIKLANKLDSMGLTKEADAVDEIADLMSSGEDEEGQISCIPIDEWEGPPDGMEIHSHSTSGGVDLFKKVLNDGFRVASSGHGDLGITFLREDPLGVVESLRRRASPDNSHYNLGPTVILAAFDEALTSDTGIQDHIIEAVREHGPDFYAPKPMKNVRVFEEWGEDHEWSDNAYKMPGKFIYAVYNGANDTICINPNWDGSSGTDYGQRLVDNQNEYMSLTGRGAEEAVAEVVQVGSDTDYDVW